MKNKLINNKRKWYSINNRDEKQSYANKT